MGIHAAQSSPFRGLVVLALVLAAATGRAQSTLELSSSSLAFTAARGGDSPPPRHSAVTSAVTERIEFTAEVEAVGGANTSWLALNLRRGTTPASIRVSIDQSGLGVGRYAARAVIRSGSRSIPIDVTLAVVEAAAVLRVAPAALRFDVGAATTGISEQSLFVGNAGGGDLSYTVAVVKGAAWLSVASPSGAAAANRQGLVRVAVNPGKAKPADYGVVRIQAGAGTVDVPVSVLRRQPGPILGVNLTALKFEARENQGNSNNRNILVLNLGDGSLDWQAEVLQGAEWLTLTMPTGRAMPDELGRLGLNANPGTLPAGAYYGLVRVSAPAAANGPQYIGAVLNVAPAADPPTPDPSPQGLFFVGDPQQEPPPNQPLRVFVSSRQPVQFQASASTSDGVDWLRVEPQSGVSSTDNTAMLRVTVNPGMLKPGVYAGEVTLAFANRTIRTTNITLVAPGNGSAALPAKGTRLAGSCIPTRLSLTQTGLVNNFSSPAAWPSPLIVRLADDCGAPVLNADVVSTFSSNDPPLPMALTNALVGLYSATWLPRGSGNVVVTTIASAPGLGIARAEIIGGVTGSQEAPVLYPGALLSNFNPQPGAPLAPGTPVQLFGSSLSSVTDSAGGLPLPLSIANTSMLIGPTRAPLYFVSPGQMNVQIPPELAADRRYAIAILVGNRYTVADPLVVAAAWPALIATGGVAVSQHADSSPVSSQAPARPGEEITISAAGLGVTNPAVAGGAVPPPGVTARVELMPTVTIGGRNATVRDAVLTPDVVGVYRIAVQVPAGLDAGNQDVEIEQNGVVSNRAVISVRP